MVQALERRVPGRQYVLAYCCMVPVYAVVVKLRMCRVKSAAKLVQAPPSGMRFRGNFIESEGGTH